MEPGQGRAADTDHRPRAWAVLAVALALMALVTALSTAHGRPSASALARDGRPNVTAGSRPRAQVPPSIAPLGRQAAIGRAPARHAGASMIPVDLPAGGAAGTSVTVGPTTETTSLTPVTTGPPGQLASALSGTGRPEDPSVASTSARAASAASVPAAASTSARGPAAASAPSAASTSAAASSQPKARGVLRGTLGPSAPQASATVAGGGVVAAEATWVGTTALALAVTCSSGISESRTGASGLSLELDDSAGSSGTCTVTLGLLPGAHGTATYTLTVQPAG